MRLDRRVADHERLGDLGVRQSAGDQAKYELLQMFSAVFGIPLSFTALITGVTLGLGTKWGVFRHAWVTVKLALLLSVILVGAFVIGPATSDMHNGQGGAETRLILAASWDVVALTAATALSVYKPARARAARPRSGGARGPRG